MGTFGGDNGKANFINDAGEIAGSADFPGNAIHHAFLWEKGVMADLGTVGTDACSRASAINSKGQIVGGSSDCHTFLHAYLWEHGGPMLDLNTFVPPASGLTLTLALYINDRGEIADTGTLANGDTHAFLLVPCGEGEEGCREGAEGATAAVLDTTAPVTQRPPSTTAANAALSEGPSGILDRLRVRPLPWYHFPDLGTGPTN